MSNWTNNKETMKQWGILAVDKVPTKILNYLKNNN